MMIRLKPRQMPKQPALPEQRADLTTDGAQPSESVAAVAQPVVPKKAASLPPAPTPRKGPPPTRSRWQR
jgi:hypothetical protein